MYFYVDGHAYSFLCFWVLFWNTLIYCDDAYNEILLTAQTIDAEIDYKVKYQHIRYPLKSINDHHPLCAVFPATGALLSWIYCVCISSNIPNWICMHSNSQHNIRIQWMGEKRWRETEIRTRIIKYNRVPFNDRNTNENIEYRVGHGIMKLINNWPFAQYKPITANEKNACRMRGRRKRKKKVPSSQSTGYSTVSCMLYYFFCVLGGSILAFYVRRRHFLSCVKCETECV